MNDHWGIQVKGLESFEFNNGFPIFPKGYTSYDEWCEEHELYEGPPEISVIAKDFEHGKKSYGWPCCDKIIISNHTNSFEEINFYIKIANILAERLNTEGVASPKLPAPARP